MLNINHDIILYRQNNEIYSNLDRQIDIQSDGNWDRQKLYDRL